MLRNGHDGCSAAKGGIAYGLETQAFEPQVLGGSTGLYRIDLPDGDYVIRKLTPIEAERLQTLPDNYTAGVSNAQRYKQIGNGWTVDVIAHILGFIPE